MIDIYFREEYGKIYELNGDGKLETFRIEGRNGKLIYHFLKREIPIALEGKKYYDIITPYGYGGPLFYDYPDESALEKLKSQFQGEFSEYCQKGDIVSEFIRFHPIIKNHQLLMDYMEVVYNRDTIAIDIFTEDEEKILESFKIKCRATTRRAKKNNIRIEITDSVEDLYSVYRKTMERNHALDYYVFSKEFFQNTMKLLGEGAKIFSAFYQDKLIASTLIIHEGEYMHGHLIGTDPEYRNLSSNNLIILEVIKWGARNGKKYYHLGGGYAGNGDHIYDFKSGFTKGEPYQFYVGKKIHNSEAYNKLVQEKEKIKEIEDREFFPLYRSE